MKVKPLIAGALRPNPMQTDDDNNDNIYPIEGIVPRSVHNGKSYVEFDGTDAFLSGANTFKPGTGDFTVAEWIKTPSPFLNTTPVYGFSKFKDSQNYIYAGISWNVFPPGHFIFFIALVNNIAVAQYYVRNAATTNYGGQWIHLAFVFDRSVGAGGGTAYINGAAITPGATFFNTTTTDSADFDAPLQYGRVNAGTGYAYTSSGHAVADLRFYRKAFTADEITALYNESIIKRANAVSHEVKATIGNMWTFGDTKGDVTTKVPGVFNDINQALDNDRNAVDNYSDQINNSRNSVGELVANGDFSSALDSSEWTVTVQTGSGAWSVASGSCFTTLDGSILNSVANNAVIGGLYSIKFQFAPTIDVGGSANLKVYFGGVSSDNLVATLTSSGTYEYTVRAFGTTPNVSFEADITNSGGTNSMRVLNVSVTRIHHNGFITHNVELDDLKKQDISNNPNRRLDG
tara:strand:- start:360 stop:1739 length:1380 start_codon:yes stop_codon:yes gene_type:complete